MYLNLNLQGLGGFANNDYWSSEEITSDYARVKNFNNRNLSASSKGNPGFVRAVRAF
jgi:hypothetical protein